MFTLELTFAQLDRVPGAFEHLQNLFVGYLHVALNYICTGLCRAGSVSTLLTLIGRVLKYWIQSSLMPKATQKSAHDKHTMSNEESEIPSGSEEFTGSEQEPDPEVLFQQFGPNQPVPSMFIPYIEGLKMDWMMGFTIGF